MKALKIRVEIDEVEIDENYAEFDPPLRHIGHMTRYLSGHKEFAGNLSDPVGWEAQHAAVRIIDEATSRLRSGSDAGRKAHDGEGDLEDHRHDDHEDQELDS